jgi:hypothetical protein
VHACASAHGSLCMLKLALPGRQGGPRKRVQSPSLSESECVLLTPDHVPMGCGLATAVRAVWLRLSGKHPKIQPHEGTQESAGAPMWAQGR